MATPVNESYSVASGQTISAGRFHTRPAWRRALLNGVCGIVPTSNTLENINPAKDPTVNPNYPGAAAWGGNQYAMFLAWSGACYDKVLDNWWWPLQEGHADGGSNANYKIGMLNESPTFVMVKKPSGAIGNILNTNDGQEITGVYSDGRLRAVHSYNNSVYAQGTGPVISRLAGFYSSGQKGAQKAYKLNETTGEATLISDYTSLSSSTPYGGGAYDSLRNCIWSTGVGNTNLLKIDLTTNTTTVAVVGDNYVNAYARLVYLDAYDLLLVIHNGGAGYPQSIYFWDVSTSTPTKIEPTLTGAFSTGLVLNGQVGADWDDVNHILYLWNNQTSRNELSTLTPSGNPKTQSWTKGFRVFTGSTPTAACTNGTYGRFVYSPKLKGCLVINSADSTVLTERPYFFSTESVND